VIEVRGLHVKAGGFDVKVERLMIGRGEYGVIMGPSGAGKTILLETIAGFWKPLEGKIVIDGVDVTKLPPERRGLSFVPQDYALWPHLTVFENIAYGLKARRVPEEEVKRRVLEVSEVMGIRHLLQRSPKTLSGGEMQRVALARALVVEPKAILLDEPLSSLDAKTRESIKDFLKELHGRLGFTALHVTHDPIEAAELGDRIAVMAEGKIVQVGKPSEVFGRPESLEVAWLTGRPNVIKGTVSDWRGGVAVVRASPGVDVVAIHRSPLREGERVLVFVMPEDIVVSKTPQQGSARNVLELHVASMEDKGPLKLVKARKDGVKLRALITRGAYEELGLTKGDRVYMQFKASAARVVPLKA